MGTLGPRSGPEEGRTNWDHAEERLKALEPDGGAAYAVIKQIAEDPIAALTAAKDLLGTEGVESKTALALIVKVVGRTWSTQPDEVGAVVEAVLAEHRLTPMVTALLEQEYKRTAAYGFMLRAFPPALVQLSQSFSVAVERPAGDEESDLHEASGS